MLVCRSKVSKPKLYWFELNYFFSVAYIFKLVKKLF